MATIAKNGAYDTLIIRKDPKFGNKWCIYQDGNSNRMVQRVFDSPEWAKKYIKEDLPAWKDAKIRVKNSCTSTNPVVQNAVANSVSVSDADYQKMQEQIRVRKELEDLTNKALVLLPQLGNIQRAASKIAPGGLVSVTVQKAIDTLKKLS